MSTVGQVQDTGSAFAIATGSLIDGRGGAPVPDAIIRVEGGRITAVGPAGAFGALDVPVRDFRRFLSRLAEVEAGALAEPLKTLRRRGVGAIT